MWVPPAPRYTAKEVDDIMKEVDLNGDGAHDPTGERASERSARSTETGGVDPDRSPTAARRLRSLLSW